MYSCAQCHRVFTKRAVFESHQARIRPCYPLVIAPLIVSAPILSAPIVPSKPIIPCDSLKPLIKWVGGKTQILDDILQRFPRTCRNYHEPFLGGGSVLLGVLSAIRAGRLNVTGTLYASDINPSIIGLYQAVQKEPDALLTELRILMSDFSSCHGIRVNRLPTTREEALTSRESYYYWSRTQFNRLTPQEKQGTRGAALFLFLNKTCFRGVYREGPHGFNVPYGNNKNPGIVDEAHLRAVSEWIQPVVFRVAPFMDALQFIEAGDMVYLDPPYVPETATSFVSYTANGFQHHSDLFERCHVMAARGVSWMMSNSDVPLVRDAFPPPYSTTVLVCRRAIHSTKPDSTTNEVLICCGGL